MWTLRPLIAVCVLVSCLSTLDSSSVLAYPSFRDDEDYHSSLNAIVDSSSDENEDTQSRTSETSNVRGGIHEDYTREGSSSKGPKNSIHSEFFERYYSQSPSRRGPGIVSKADEANLLPIWSEPKRERVLVNDGIFEHRGSERSTHAVENINRLLTNSNSRVKSKPFNDESILNSRYTTKMTDFHLSKPDYRTPSRYLANINKVIDVDRQSYSEDADDEKSIRKSGGASVVSLMSSTESILPHRNVLPSHDSLRNGFYAMSSDSDIGDSLSVVPSTEEYGPTFVSAKERRNRNLRKSRLRNDYNDYVSIVEDSMNKIPTNRASEDLDTLEKSSSQNSSGSSSPTPKKRRSSTSRRFLQLFDSNIGRMMTQPVRAPRTSKNPTLSGGEFLNTVFGRRLSTVRGKSEESASDERQLDQMD